MIHCDVIPSTLQAQPYQHIRVNDFDFDEDIDKLKVTEAFNKSITVFPIPDDTNVFKLHRYASYRAINYSFSRDAIKLL